jgi:hypothetical protein
VLGGDRRGDGGVVAEEAGEDVNESVEVAGAEKFQKLCRERCWTPRRLGV